MKRKITFLCIILCLNTFTYAQQSSIDSLKAIYSQLDSKYFPSRVLHNRSPAYVWSLDPNYQASPYSYTGAIPAPLIEKGWWTMLANDMKHSALDTNLVPSANLFKRRDSTARHSYEVPIASLHINFHQMLPWAVDSGYLFYDTTSERLSTMPDTLWLDKPNNVFEYFPNGDSLAYLAFCAHETFAGAITNSAIYKAGTSFTITFGLSKALFISNQGVDPNLVEIDFDNGEGFKQVNFDVPIRVNYSNAGSWDSYERELRMRFTYNGRIVETKMPLTIVPNASVADRELFASQLNYTCQVPTNGFRPDEAKVSIRYGNPRNQLLKPVLLIEGFESAIRDYGDITYQALATGYITNEAGDEIFKQAKLLKNAFDSLVLLGYDIVYIDNKNGRDYIQANALNAIKTIQWINQELITNGSSEKLVVIGASMGGLVARYALSKMEADGCCHNTRLYATFDSPHNGAHIPLGLQESVRSLRDQFAWVDDLFFDGEKIKPAWDDALNGPGARQMLVAHIDPDAEPVRQRFVEEFDSLGHPKQCRRIAIVNGSEQALPNLITHPDKQYYDGSFTVPLPINHWVGTSVFHVVGNVLGVLVPYPLLKVTAWAENSPTGKIFERNQMGRASKIAGIIGLTHGTSVAVQIIAKALSFIPTIGTAAYPVILAAQAAANITLPNKHALNLLLTTYKTAYPTPVNFPNYSEAPGSTNHTPETIAKSLNSFGFKIITVNTPTHNFISSVSALDVDTNNLFLNISNVSIPLSLSGKIPFDTYWAPARGDEAIDRNMEHIEVTRDLYKWLIDQIEYNPQLGHPQFAIGSTSGTTTLNGYYNYGKSGVPNAPFLKNLVGVDVLNNGRLYINRFGTIGYIGGTQSTSTGSFYTCYSGGACDNPVVRLFDGAEFVIGQNGFNNKADMIFTKDTRLEILSGGKLTVSNNSRLLIEPGAELIIHPGAIVELAGENAVLELQGKLTLKANAVLKPTGSGFVRLNYASSTPLAQRFNFESNAELLLQKADTSEKVLEVLNQADIDWTRGKVTLNQGKVELGENAVLGLRGKVSSTHVTYKNLDGQPYKSVRLFGQSNVTFENSYFYGGKRQLEALLTVFGNELTIKDCKFFDAQNAGFYAEGSGVKVKNCRFKRGATGIEVVNATNASLIENTVCEDQTNRGIHFKGQSAVALNIESTDVKRASVGITAEDVSLRMMCSRSIDNNSTGLEAIGSYINLSNDAKNTFAGNDIGIELDDAMDLRMRNGLNHIFNNNVYEVEGSFDNNHALGSNASVDMYNNNMSYLGSNMLNVNMFTQAGAPVGVHNYYNPNSHMIWSCYVQPSPYSDFVLEYPSFRVVNNSNFSNVYYSDAFYSAISEVSFGEITVNDLSAISKLNSLLSIPIANPTANEIALQEYGFRMMMTALSNAYDQQLVPLNRAIENEPENPYLSMVTDEINDRLLENGGIDQELMYELNLAKAHMYRMAEHYDYALQVLSDAEANASFDELMETSYWECICDAEEDLLQNKLSADEYLEQKLSCQAQLAAKRGKEPIVRGITTEAQITQKKSVVSSLLPNPATTYVEVRLNTLQVDLTAVLTDIGGNEFLQREIKSQESAFRLNLAKLAPGVYLLNIYENGNHIETKKIVKH